MHQKLKIDKTSNAPKLKMLEQTSSQTSWSFFARMFVVRAFYFFILHLSSTEKLCQFKRTCCIVIWNVRFYYMFDSLQRSIFHRWSKKCSLFCVAHFFFSPIQNILNINFFQIVSNYRQPFSAHCAHRFHCDDLIECEIVMLCYSYFIISETLEWIRSKWMRQKHREAIRNSAYGEWWTAIGNYSKPFYHLPF